MKVVILCGGKGTRIREETEYRPKPMVPVGEHPILWHIMNHYSTFDVNEFVLCLGYKGDMIKEYFRNYTWQKSDITLDLKNNKILNDNSNDIENWIVSMVNTGNESLTAERIYRIRDYIDEENFFLTYGDGIGNINIDDLYKFHLKSGKMCTITGVQPPGRFGEIKFLNNGDVTRFNEKPQVEGGYINGGFMVLNRKIFDFLSDKTDTMFEANPMKELVKNNQLGVYLHNGFWRCMDTYAEMQMLNKIWQSGNIPWRK